MARANPLSLEQVRQQLDYDPETGVFRWKVPKKGIAGPGTEAGCIHPVLGYRLVGVLRQRHYGHRLAWFMHYGEWPTDQIDHINGDRADNRIANLRQATHAENQMNRHTTRPNKNGLRGIDHDPKTGKYRARVVVNKVKHNLGYFDTPEAAHAAYVREVRRLNPLTPV